MGRPKGAKNKPKAEPLIPIGSTVEVMDAALRHELEFDHDSMPAEPALDIPPDWQMGALLNVRNTGADYCVTLYPEEYDWRHPERAVRFTNPGRCQDFVSQWYARVWVDPRA